MAHATLDKDGETAEYALHAVDLVLKVHQTTTGRVSKSATHTITGVHARRFVRSRPSARAVRCLVL